MTSADLPWLPRAPDDVRARCRELAAAVNPGRVLQSLAGSALDGNQLRQVARAHDTLPDNGSASDPFAPFTLGIAGTATLEHLVPALVGSALRYGLALRCIVADYGQLFQVAHDPASAINAGKVDAVLLALDHRGAGLSPSTGDATVAAAAVAHTLQLIDDVRAGFRRNAHAPSIVTTISEPPEPLFGHLDLAMPATLRALVAEFNLQLARRLHADGDVLFDVAALAASVGTDAWHAPRDWNIAKFPFDPRFVPLWADHAARLLAALRGKTRRVLVLDLDNTLWGGVVGDDGVGGIMLGNGNPTGEAHLEVQRYALALRERGIVLAVSSKNDDTVARSAVREHPDMLLREEHFAVFQANWEDKATNLRAIAKQLNVGLDALVLVDDNPAERALVREMLPQVAVPELPADPARFVRTLAAAGYFETVSFSQDDRRRAEFYAGNAQRAALEEQTGDLDAYLRSLDMVIDLRAFDAVGRARIVQLINKTNQFNLTTRRYSDPEIAAFEADPDVFTLQVRLTDRFGDNGMISVVIARPAAENALEIDTWLMSCRVLGRRVEEMVLREVLQYARSRGYTHVVGRYIRTDRNAIAADFFARMGFEPGDSSGTESWWALDAAAEVPAGPMRVARPIAP